MARVDIELTDTWQLVSSVSCVLTVSTTPDGGALSLNTTASDDAAMVTHPAAGRQYMQTSAVETWAKGAGGIINVDGS